MVASPGVVGAAASSLRWPVDVVLIDGSLPDESVLEWAVRPGAVGFVYDGRTDSADQVLAQVSRWVETYGEQIRSLTLLAHGSSGQFMLGNQWLADQTFSADAAWRLLASELVPDATINLLGCNVAASAAGRDLLDRVATATHAQVFASDDLTGRGGDWTLEACSAGADVEHAVDWERVLNPEILQNWTGTLNAVQLDSTASVSLLFGNFVNWSHSVGSGADRYLLVGLSLWSTTSVNSVTYAGQALTKLQSQTVSVTGRVEIWGLASPPVGTANVAVSLGGLTAMVAGSASFSSVNVDTPISNTSTASATSGGPVVSIDNTAGGMIFAATSARGDMNLTQTSGETSLWSANITPNPAGAAVVTSQTGALNVGWNTSRSNPWAAVAVQLLPDNFVVTNTNDSGPGSLRQVITEANNSGTAQTITFAIPGSGVQTITLASPLPALTQSITVDATSQPGYAGTPLVEVDGTATPYGTNGIEVLANNCVVEGLSLYGFTGNGVQVDTGSTNTVVRANFLGLTAAGAAGPMNGCGVVFTGGSGGVVGGTNPSDRNVISNNGGGIRLELGTTGVVVEGNEIGTDASGTTCIPNAFYGIQILDSPGNLIGGSIPGAGNLIAGNGGRGIDVDGSTSVGNMIQGNRIGTTAAGNAPLGNGGEGITLDAAVNTRIGGTNPGEGNVIGGSGAEGVWLIHGATGSVIQGNFIGTDTTGTVPLGNAQGGIRVGNNAGNASNNLIGGTVAGAGNTIAFNTSVGIAVDCTGGGTSVGNAILGNAVYGNSSLGIDLDDSYSSPSSPGVTANDPGDADTGGNNRQNYPVLSFVHIPSTSQLSVAGTLNSAPYAYYRIEFFASEEPDTSGYGQGRTFLGYLDVATDMGGNASFSATLPVNVTAGTYVSATATRSNAAFTSFTDTSEFSKVSLAGNHAPVGTSATVSTLMNSVYTFQTADFGFNDPLDTPPNILLNLEITTLPAVGVLSLSGIPLTAGQFVSAVNLTAGLLQFTPAANLFSSPYTTFTFQVQDDGGAVNGGADLDPSPRTLTINVSNAAPTVATPASATPTPAIGTSTALSVLGADDGGESNLTYTWSTVSSPSGAAAPSFSINGTNASKNVTVTFNQAGSYAFLVTIIDPGGLATTSTVNVTVNQTLTTISVVGGPSAMAENTSYPFTATALDQFGHALAIQPTLTWSVDAGGAGGTVDASGRYTTPNSSSGSDVLRVTSGMVSGTASVAVTGRTESSVAGSTWETRPCRPRSPTPAASIPSPRRRRKLSDFRPVSVSVPHLYRRHGSHGPRLP
ncbi:MAG: DUF4347 domain-containing protein [Isosphaeraceae bacterium]